jgi:hypothetical protein
MDDLDLRDFFDAFDRGDPMMLAAISELQAEIKRVAPELLAKDANWFRTWTWGGKRDLLTGLLERNGRFISPS